MPLKLFSYTNKQATAIISIPPTKTVYQAGEVFDPQGMSIEITDIDNSKYTFTEFAFGADQLKPLTAGTTEYILYFTFNNSTLKVKQPITVTNVEPTFCTVIPSISSECTSMISSVAGVTMGSAGIIATFSATVNPGYTFSGWYDATGTLISASNPYSFAISKDVTYYAKATAIVTTPDYLCFTADEDNVSIGMSMYQDIISDNNKFEGLQYSLDKQTWSDFTEPVILAKNQSLYLKGNNNRISVGDDDSTATGAKRVYFITSGNFYASGNLMSLLDETCQSVTIPTAHKGVFYRLFDSCRGMLSAPKLPATSLYLSCYYGLFAYCVSLREAPELPATTLSNYAYAKMFQSCISLTTMPELPATTMAAEAYFEMFSDCSGLTTTHKLPATTLASGCYQHMFSGCSALVTPPEIAATTLAQGCCQGMFMNCHSLERTPKLLATRDSLYCYDYMFRNCRNLKIVDRINTQPSSPYAQYYGGSFSQMFEECTKIEQVTVGFTEFNTKALCRTENPLTGVWLADVGSTGTFICPYELCDINRTYCIPPAGWTMQDL